MVRALLAAPPPVPVDSIAPTSAATSTRRALWGAGQVLASQVALALAGVASLSVLGRQLGPALYGDFSLFVTLVAVVTYQDVGRQLLIHELAKDRSATAELDALTRMSTLLIVALAVAVGALVLQPVAAAALIAVTLLHGSSSRDYAALAVTGRVGAVTAIRNFAWAAAFAAVAGLSFVASGPLGYCAPFVVAGAVTCASYRALAERRERPRAQPSSDPWWARVSGWTVLRRSPRWPEHRRAALDLLGFSIASSTIASVDRILLEKLADGTQLGLYCGAADLALRVHVVGSALSAALYPMLATSLHESGYDAAARKFVRIAGLAIAGYFAGIVALLAFDRTLLDLFLGPAFAGSRPLFALFAIGLFVHAFGFLLTPWQRAQGDFATQRAAYARAAALMILVGVVTVPLYGALGAVIAYLVSRAAELQLLVREVRRMPRALLPRRKLVLAGAMFAIVVSFALWRFAGA